MNASISWRSTSLQKRQVRTSCASKSSKSAMWDKFKARHDRLAKIIDDAARPILNEVHELAKEDAKDFVDAVRIDPKKTHSHDPATPSYSAGGERREWRDVVDTDIDVDFEASGR